MTFMLSLIFTELREVSMEHLQRMWIASRERLPSGHLVPSLLWLTYALIIETIFSQAYHDFLVFITSNIPRYYLDFPDILLAALHDSVVWKRIPGAALV